jgi:hypothetical protein
LWSPVGSMHSAPSTLPKMQRGTCSDVLEITAHPMASIEIGHLGFHQGLPKNPHGAQTGHRVSDEFKCLSILHSGGGRVPSVRVAGDPTEAAGLDLPRTRLGEKTRRRPTTDDNDKVLHHSDPRVRRYRFATERRRTDAGWTVWATKSLKSSGRVGLILD